jgi:hypothetical protein
MVSVCLTGGPCCRWSMGSGGARQTRRLITLLAGGWRPPDWGPSGAGRTRGARVPAGLVTPSRVTPDRGRAAADGRRCGATPGRWGPARVSPGPLWRWPTARRGAPGRSPPRLAWRGSPGRAAVGRVCSAVLAPARGSRGRLGGVVPGVVASADGRAPDNGPPRHLRRGRVAPGGSPSWCARPGAAAHPWRRPRGAGPRHA